MVEHGGLNAVDQGAGRDQVPEQPAGADHLIGDEVVTVLVGSLRTALSPRAEGENKEHLRLLAESVDRLPPIIVHRATMRVIDGMHRLRVATARGATHVQVRFFTGDERDAFVLAVRLNTRHGLPLSLSDRLAAAARIMKSHPEWSDRMIAALTGLTHKTVRGIRHRPGTEVPQQSFRRGQDGRIRPINSAQGRRLAAALIADRPRASLREIAREAGIAIATARDVRNRLRSGADPVPERQRGDAAGLPGGFPRPSVPQQPASQAPPADPVPEQQRNNEAGGPGGPQRPPATPAEPHVVLRHLRQDPSLRFSEVGREVLRLLDTGSVDAGQWARLAASVPPHCADLVAEIARGCAQAYLQFAQQLETNVRSAM
jgi:hypothetical protein